MAGDDAKGHRARLRERFLNGGAEALHDYEILEMALFAANPRGDTKPLAKRLIKQFGSLNAAVSADPARLRAVDGMGEASVAAVKLIQVAAHRMLRGAAMDGDVISSWQALLDYCRVAMADERTEQFRILFLDIKNRLIADEVQQRGTVDHTPVYPREVVKRALELHASAIIMVHNHPSGDPMPSKADIVMTRQVRDAAATVGVDLHDHLVIGRAGHESFRSLGLL